MSNSVRVRFAPSPTGYLHVGGARTALFNWLFARRNGGKLILRIEDTDAARNTPEAMAAIFDGLRWLGIQWDEGPEVGGDFGPYFQSQRNAIYASYLEKLQEKGCVYEDGGAIRFRSPKKEIIMDDKICGEVKIDRSHEPDMTLRRPDGSFIFHFANVVDDIEMRITHVIRGEDHLMNTPKHLELFEAFGVTPPVYAHMPLFLNADGSKMSKRDQGAAVGSYIEEAFVPDAVRNYLCLLGWSPKDDREKMPVEDIIALFDWDHLNRSPSRFDYTKCLWLNSQYLAEKSEDEFVAHCLPWLEKNRTDLVSLAGAKLVPALKLMRPKIKHVPETSAHLTMLFDDAAVLDETGRIKVAAQANARVLLEAMQAALAGVGEWTQENIHTALQNTATSLGVKPGALMFPLRLAVTGASTGVDLQPALEMLGQATVTSRIASRLPQICGG